jgi:very-short-patch-repair endonuclease
LRQKPIGGYIVDFVCNSLKLIIEVDGDSHFTDEAIVYDKERTKFLE